MRVECQLVEQSIQLCYMSLPQNDPQSKSNRDEAVQCDRSRTCCARLTGEGRSAIAVVALRGRDAETIIDRCIRFATDRAVEPGQIRFGVWTGPKNQNGVSVHQDGESVVATLLDDQTWEIHCHGGPAAVDRILSDMQQAGAQRVMDLDQSAALVITEAEAVLQSCLTERTAAIALTQVRGALRNWAERVLAMPDPARALATARSDAQSILQSAPWTTRLAQPWKIVLIGPPNVGKSSLLNVLVGFDRSITYDQAGTTRDVLHAETVIDGIPVRMSDTAGIRDSQEPIEAEGMRRALGAAEGADIVVHVGDATADVAGEVSIPNHLPLIRVLNKIDLVDQDSPTSFDVVTSAVTGQGIEALLHRLASEINQYQPPPDSPAVMNQRQKNLVNEISQASSGFPLATTLRELIGESPSVEE